MAVIERAQVAGHRLLEGQHLVAALLDVEGERVERVVVLDELLGPLQVVGQQHLGAAGDALGDQGGQPDDVGSDLVELLVERASLASPASLSGGLAMV